MATNILSPAELAKANESKPTSPKSNGQPLLLYPMETSDDILCQGRRFYVRDIAVAVKKSFFDLFISLLIENKLYLCRIIILRFTVTDVSFVLICD
jgi:hypothetical protein